jgi:hypothetical protein
MRKVLGILEHWETLVCLFVWSKKKVVSCQCLCYGLGVQSLVILVYSYRYSFQRFFFQISVYVCMSVCLYTEYLQAGLAMISKTT